ncbi:hypothetical protein [Actinoplanes couchii]|uniref:Integral membrane protein n=1 Tax=Actinoplanes couchii TaxID=403638 RepID=A0ABQ3X7V2_9ACTN|nr:hypothetical protein [Actinoplanes couchii]MDR6322324.1 fumarate reductase subunit D [Actinoplanes couchii]GID54483.1 hypothetical protein Aco03nite_028870 [Actinoplanes couchii]
MLTVLFGSIAVAEAVVLGLVIALHRRRPDTASLLPAAVILALIWDNAIVATGTAIGAGDTLRALSYPRFVAHALLVPLLIPVGVALCRAHGIRFLSNRPVRAASTTLTVTLIAVGLWQDVRTLDLQPMSYAGTLRYTNEAAHGAPIPAVATILVLIVLGAILLSRTRSP